MQIHELDTYIGTPSETDFMAVDDGTETFKIPMPSVGVSTQMTLAEAEAGTETAPRVITPAVLNSFVTANYVDIDTGNIELDASAQSGDDYDLKTILTTLGWLNDVIV